MSTVMILLEVESIGDMGRLIEAVTEVDGFKRMDLLYPDRELIAVESRPRERSRARTKSEEQRT